MNRAVQKVAEDHLSGRPEITEGLLNRVEVAIRAYDPCLSCATHALGQMPLEVELVDADGRGASTRRARRVVSAPRPLVLGLGQPGPPRRRPRPGLRRRPRRAWRLPGVTVESGLPAPGRGRGGGRPRTTRVLFVDADRAGERAVPVPAGSSRAGGSPGFTTHSVAPGAPAGARAASLFGARPEAWLMGIRGYDFDEFGEELSAAARANLAAAAAFVRDAHARRRLPGVCVAGVASSSDAARMPARGGRPCPRRKAR